MARLVVFVTLALFFLSLAGPATAGKKQPPPPRPPAHPGELAQLQRDLANVVSTQQAELSNVDKRYRAEVAKLDLGKLYFEVGSLWFQRDLALQKLIDRSALKQINHKYQPRIDELQKQIAAREQKLNQLNGKLNAAVSKVEGHYRSRLRKVDGAEDKLEAKLWEVLAERNEELLKLINSPEVRTRTRELQGRIDAQYRRIAARLKKQQEIGIHKLRKLAELDRNCARWLAELDGSRPDVELARLLEKQRLELVDVIDATVRAEILATYQADIAIIEGRVASRKARLSELAKWKLEQAAEIGAWFLAEIAGLDLLETLMIELADLRALQLNGLVSLVVAEQAQAIIKRYEPKIEGLEAKILTKDVQMLKVLEHMEAEIARSTAATRAEISKVDSGEDALEFKLARLYEQRWAEMVQAVGRINIKGVLNEYDPKIARAKRELAMAEKQYMTATQHYFNDTNAIVRRHAPQIAHLQQHIGQLMNLPR
jgi:hypothetical protein